MAILLQSSDSDVLLGTLSILLMIVQVDAGREALRPGSPLAPGLATGMARVETLGDAFLAEAVADLRRELRGAGA